MIYLKGITIADIESSYKITRRFRKLRIPFLSEEELEKFRFETEQQYVNKRVSLMYEEKE